MINYDSALQLIQESFDSLHKSGMTTEEIKVNNDTCILGEDSPLDSIGFVTLFSEIEDRLYQTINVDIYLVLDEISEFDINSPYLSAEVIAKYIVNKANSN
jgi:hypothetical protein